MSMGHSGNRLIDVVKDDHAVIEGKTQIGQVPIIDRRVRQSLHIADGIVAGVADRPAAKAR